MAEDVQQKSGAAPKVSTYAAISGDPERRIVWLIVVGAVVVLVATGRVFKPKG